MWSILVAYRVS